MTPSWHKVLSEAAAHGKVAYPRSCGLMPVETLPVISEMVHDGYLSFVDVVLVTINGNITFSCDLYQLTPAGVVLCKSLGISTREP